MKMAALQLMQQKANKDTKTDAPAITDGGDADAALTKAGAAEDSTGNAKQTDGSSSAASQTETDREEISSKPATNGPLDLTATQNGECKSPLAGKELEESIPGLAQAKELAETLVGEDGSCIGRSKNDPQIIWPGQCREKYSGGEPQIKVISVALILRKTVFYWHS